MRREDIDASLPHADLLIESADEVMADGGSCVAGPDGEWVLAPVTGSESLKRRGDRSLARSRGTAQPGCRGALLAT